jgi:hypothetical protein
MDTYWLAIALLVVLFSAAPVYRRYLLRRTLRNLKIEGAVVVLRFWRPGLIRYHRSQWDAEVLLVPPGEASRGGDQGHLRLRGELRRSTPTVEVSPRAHSHEPPPAPDGMATGDPKFDQVFRLSGDAGLSALVFNPEVRDLVLRLHALGGRVAYLRDGEVGVQGPLGSGPVELRQFLATCELLLDLIAKAVSALPGKV